MSRMTTRSMTRAMQDAKIHAAKIQSIIEEMQQMNRPTTRSMSDLSHKRFHEDPYPSNKRPRIERDTEKGECLVWMMFAITLINAGVFLYYCYVYHLEFEVQV
jgi:hypothetical protein